MNESRWRAEIRMDVELTYPGIAAQAIFVHRLIDGFGQGSVLVKPGANDDSVWCNPQFDGKVTYAS